MISPTERRNDLLFYLGSIGYLLLLISIRLAVGDGKTNGVICLVIGASFYFPLLIYRFLGTERPLSARSNKRAVRVRTLFLIVLGLQARLLFWGCEPDVLSDDVYRYLWDGKVQAHAINPYRFAPADPRLDHLGKNSFYARINHKQYRTIYPPASQAVFLASYLLFGESLTGLRFILLLFELLTCYFLSRLLADRRRVFIFFLSPLVIVEVYLGMHVDIIGVCFLAGALYLLKTRRAYLALILLALSVLVKYVALVAVPVFFLQLAGSDRALRGRSTARLIAYFASRGSFFFAVIVAAYLPYLVSGGTVVFEQLLFYGAYWRFNSLLDPLIRVFGESVALPLKGALAVALLTYICLQGRRSTALQGRARLGLISQLRLCLLALLLLNGTFYPWYFIWLLPFLAFELIASEVLLGALLPISYVVLIRFRADGVWHDSIIVRLIEFIPFFGIFAYDIARGRYVQAQKNRSNNSSPGRGGISANSP